MSTYKNLFQCNPVGLGPDERHDKIKHPHFEWLYVDNLGVRWIDYELAKQTYQSITEGDHILCTTMDGKRIYTKGRMATIYQAWVNPEYDGEKLVHLDHNPFNFKPNNIVPVKKAGLNWRVDQREFIVNTVEEMLRRDRDKDLRPDYWLSQGIPKKIVEYYAKKKVIPNCRPYKQKTSPDPKKSRWVRHLDGEEEQEVIKLYTNGMKVPDITRLLISSGKDSPFENLNQAIWKLIYKNKLNKK